jgi:hypothetical protein
MGGNQVAQEIIAGMGTSLIYQILEEGKRLTRYLLGLDEDLQRGGEIKSPNEDSRPAPEKIPMLGRHADHLGDDPERHREGIVADEVQLACSAGRRLCLVQHTRGYRGDSRVKAFDDSRSKCLTHQFAQASMVRWVIEKNGMPRHLDIETYLLRNRRRCLGWIHAG